MHYISSKKLRIKTLEKHISGNKKIALSDEAKKNISDCRNYLDEKLKNIATPVYGINTGFGSLCNVIIPEKDIEQLQINLVMSHACGLGDEVPKEIVKLMLFLKIQSLSYGNSGVQLQTVERLVYFYNNNVLPIVYQQGSLGASGDLAPLAHLCLPLLGMGEVYYKKKKQNTSDVLKKLNLQPIQLKSKEGLALLNGTQFMSAYASWILLKAKKISNSANIISAISLDSFNGRLEPFNEKIQNIRPHLGQIETAKAIRELLQGSEIASKSKEHVQDPYSFRCIPQVHGATKDVIDYFEKIVLTEINSVTDNPTVFPENDEIISGGNFHGQPLAFALDFISIAIAELGNISERRTYQLISGARGLPPFLTKNSGLNSGLMITQYTAAGIVSENKQLCTPSSVDSIVSSNGQEDHVSMGANAATKCFKVVNNVEKVLAIELLNAAQAMEFRRPLKSSVPIEKILSDYRKNIFFINEDKIMYQEMQKSVDFINQMS